MVQHTKKTGDVVAQAVTYATYDEAKRAYHHEMDYAMNNDDFNGLSILITDMSLNKVLYENWVREVKVAAPAAAPAE